MKAKLNFVLLAFSVNGEMKEKYSISRVRPANNIYPAVSLEQGSTCRVTFVSDGFKHPPLNKGKFKMVVGAMSLI